MSEPENFLGRWSRRKLEPTDENAAPDKPAVDDKTVENPEDAALARKPESPPAPEFDLASLPPIESIGADTDIGAFLKPGVPTSLRHAALRRAWSIDPAIRDFKGLQENDWNFNDPNGILGFGELGPEHDVAKMVARLFGDSPASEAANEPAPQPAREQSASLSGETNPASEAVGGEESVMPQSQQVATVATEENILQREESFAAQQDGSSDASPPAKVRRHGGALP